MTRSLNIGLLGAARIAPKALCQPAAVIPAARLHGIAARDKQRASLFAEEHGVAEVYDSYESLIESREIDLIYNPLPINRHAEWTIRALEAGKHVLCEKPLAMNLEEATAMQAAAEKSGKRLIEAFHYRYHPAFETCLRWVNDGHIGTLKRIDADFSVQIRDSDEEIRQLPQTGGGAMMDLGCYPLSWTLHLMDAAPSSIKAEATLTKRGVDESLQAQLGFGDGAIARLTTSMAQGTAFNAEMVIQGSEGSIRSLNPLAPQAGGKLTLTTHDGETQADVSPISSYTWQLAAVVEAIARNAPLPTEGEAILTQQAQLDAIYAAAGLGHLRQG